MFRQRRSGLVRRLWRSRALNQSDGSGRAEGGCPCGSGLRRKERGTVTRAGGNSAGEAGEREEGEQADDDRTGYRRGQEADRTVTCCLFGEWALTPRSPRLPTPKDNRGPCECDLGNIAHPFLKKLSEQNLDALLKAVESKGGALTECVMVPATELRFGTHHVSPQFLLARIYRWGDLPPSAPLKVLHHCQSFDQGGCGKVCCNPYHYSRLCGPESPPPPYSVSHSDEHKPLDSTLSYTETPSPLITPTDNTETGSSIGSSTSGGHRSHWCSVAYWEQRTRVGRLYPAYEPSLNIFYDLPQGTGLCLSQLHANANHRHRENPDGHCASLLPDYPSSRGGNNGSVQLIRSKIGHGIVLSREPDGVWVYNRSQHPVFVHSPTLDLLSARGLSVKRVMPGFSLKMFDYKSSNWMAEHGVKPESQEGPWDPHSVRISFAKGWGPCYSRQFITSCPCWLEVLLNTHR
ncbi:mothers against decapentaplegic homolog 6-like [Corythoichthys intestinalis]|uniref:mothers against decapentaplegic homolog 6-like n=1 Tax=Corythoichthys intestinalis TaxID=161448 RepID=UPI0025A634CE|nr:mothers against decapentaplegic homolog 6-like [Corythoichthys intestinalis]XP_061811215.1 mothers against decapentaplegic homolog 6-like [Nerophis lumbriciformis]